MAKTPALTVVLTISEVGHAPISCAPSAGATIAELGVGEVFATDTPRTIELALPGGRGKPGRCVCDSRACLTGSS